MTLTSYMTLTYLKLILVYVLFKTHKIYVTSYMTLRYMC